MRMHSYTNISTYIVIDIYSRYDLLPKAHKLSFRSFCFLCHCVSHSIYLLCDNGDLPWRPAKWSKCIASHYSPYALRTHIPPINANVRTNYDWQWMRRLPNAILSGFSNCKMGCLAATGQPASEWTNDNVRPFYGWQRRNCCDTTHIITLKCTLTELKMAGDGNVRWLVYTIHTCVCCVCVAIPAIDD